MNDLSCKTPLMKTLILLAILSPCAFQLPPIKIPQKNHVVLVSPSKPVEWVEMVEQVKEMEGFKPRPYVCAGGRVTIGYGHTQKAKEFSSVNKETAHELLIADLEKAEAAVDRIVKVPLNDGQKAALVSFTFNCGASNLKQLVSGPNRLNSGNYESVEEVLPLYRRANGKILRGLVERRKKELTLWRSSGNLIASNQ